jgi:hypothetical protein
MLSCPYDVFDRIAWCLLLLTAVVLMVGCVWCVRAVSDWLAVRRYERRARGAR